MGPQHVSDGKVRVVGETITASRSDTAEGMVIHQKKTRHRLVIPLHWRLREVLANTECGHLTYLVTAYGKPFTPAGFGNWFRKQCDAAGLRGCSAHGLRKRAATDLAEAGCTAHQIMSVCGFGLKEAERYTKKANQVRLATEAMRKLEHRGPDAENNGARDVK